MAAFKAHVDLFRFLLLWFVVQVHVGFPGVVSGNEILELNANAFDELSRENKCIVVLFYEGDCENCNNIVAELVKVSVPTVTDLKVGKSKDKTLSGRFGVTEFPSVLYHRKGHPILYDGEVSGDELSIWLEAAQEVSTQLLTSDTFEHLTQAATGATTGDWFVCFYKPSCENILAMMDTVAFRMKQRMNVARVDLTESPELEKRFSIQHCPTGILFRHGKMYRFPPGKFSVKLIMSFLESWYKNVQAEVVKPEPSPFDNLVETIVEYLKIYLEGPWGSWMKIGFVCFVLILLILIWILRRAQPTHRTSTRPKTD
ncbi:thioredoxin domain-containing protein-like [Liolophura sinensis]|uniref:thioredoxin domain-containing protein-like n=1 Tax=Liolophura sinensis TaxID=3198878 RepID=UPI00315967F1